MGNHNSGRRPEKYTEEFFEQAAKDVVEYAEANADDLTKAAISMVGWRAKTGYQWNRVKDWYDKSPVFAEAYDKAKSIIGERRERAGLFNVMNSGSVDKRAWQYDTEVRERENELRSIGCDTEGNPTSIKERAQLKMALQEVEELKRKLAEAEGKSD